jgi:membrane protease YdiL (CAAX protease family)
LIEEMLMRGVLFRLVQESLGSWIALGAPEWITGGAFGLEGSAIGLIVVLGVTGTLLFLARRSGQIVTPFWTRIGR